MSGLRLSEIGEARATQVFQVVCALAVAAGVALAVWGSAAGPVYWHDELFSLMVARGLLESPGAAMARLILPDVHPPLYGFLLAGWVWLFGDGEMETRSLSLLGGLGALGVLWWMGRPMLTRPALALALPWLATHWFWAVYASEARMYGLLLCGGAWVALAFARLWVEARAPGPRSLWLLCLGGLPFAFLHYSGMALFCSALLLLLLRHRRHLPLWPPVLGAGFLCVAWTAHHWLQMLWGGWIAEALGGGHPIWALPKLLVQVFFPEPLSWRNWGFGAWILLALSSIYALVLAFWWRQIRTAGGWRRWRAGWDMRDGNVLQSQLLLLGTFFLVMATAHLWKPLLIHKALVAVLPAVAICLGCLGARIFHRRHLALSGLGLVLAAAYISTAFLARENHWWRGMPYDREGVRGILAREAGDISFAPRLILFRDGSKLTISGWENAIAVLGSETGKLPRHAFLRPDPGMADARHLIPPFYFVNVLEERGHFFRDELGLDVERLSAPGPGPWFYASFLVTEPAP